MNYKQIQIGFLIGILISLGMVVVGGYMLATEEKTQTDFSDLRWVITYDNETHVFDTYEDFSKFMDNITPPHYNNPPLDPPWPEAVWVYRGTNETFADKVNGTIFVTEDKNGTSYKTYIWNGSNWINEI